MLKPHVALYITRVTGRIRTHSAMIGSFPRMGPNVYDQVELLSSHVLAIGTLENTRNLVTLGGGQGLKGLIPLGHCI